MTTTTTTSTPTPAPTLTSDQRAALRRLASVCLRIAQRRELERAQADDMLTGNGNAVNAVKPTASTIGNPTEAARRN